MQYGLVFTHAYEPVIECLLSSFYCAADTRLNPFIPGSSSLDKYNCVVLDIAKYYVMKYLYIQD